MSFLALEHYAPGGEISCLRRFNGICPSPLLLLEGKIAFNPVAPNDRTTVVIANTDGDEDD